jgi:predicted PurR-regulated permease PerM
MISAILNSVLFAFRLIALATILCLFACIILLLSFLVISQRTKQSDNTPKPISTLTPAKERRHNSTNKILNNVLTTPARKQIKADKKQQTKSTKSPSKVLKKQPTESTKLPTQQTRKPLIDMTSKELLAYAKQEKIRGYSSVYKTQKKLGLIKLIEQQSEFSE